MLPIPRCRRSGWCRSKDVVWLSDFLGRLFFGLLAGT